MQTTGLATGHLVLAVCHCVPGQAAGEKTGGGGGDSPAGQQSGRLSGQVDLVAQRKSRNTQPNWMFPRVGAEDQKIVTTTVEEGRYNE